MKTVQVRLPSVAYDILIGPGLLAEAGFLIATATSSQKLVVVSDNNVWGLYGPVLSSALKDVQIDFDYLLLPAGESSKSLASLELVYSKFAEAELGRDGLVVALGGGVIGDLSGFAAATWMRGINYVQIPTSLLAQVDSSVGGKTAVDLPSGKNLVGAFHQPSLVLTDTSTLDSLPGLELSCGMAEVVKYGAIKSKLFFEQLNCSSSAPPIEDIVETCCSIKRDIVQRDELDHGERALLNFGHTLGHAVESLGNYSKHNHGQAVAIGMVLAAQIGQKLGITKTDCADTLRQTLTSWELPVNCPYSSSEMMAQIGLDKKRQADSIKMVLLTEIGQATLQSLPISDIQKLLEELI